MRFGLRNDAQFASFMAGAHNYIIKHMTPQCNLVHPTHKTEEEKRIARNLKARAVRAKTKVV